MQTKNKRRRCVIITSYLEGELREAYTQKETDFIIAVDRGLFISLDNQITPDLAMGDFDSCGGGYDGNDYSKSQMLRGSLRPSNRSAATSGEDISERCIPANVQTITTSAEKDDTDTVLAIKKGMDLGYQDFLIVGGIGGRLDHTAANLHALSMCAEKGCKAWLADGFNRATVTSDEHFKLDRAEGYYFSLFSWSDICTGVTIRYAKYLLTDAKLTKGDSVGVSNEFLTGPAEIYLASGSLLIVLSKDR